MNERNRDVVGRWSITRGDGREDVAADETTPTATTARHQQGIDGMGKSMRVPLERRVEMQLYIATEKPKEGFGEMTEAESEAYDGIAYSFKRAGELGLVLDVPNAGVEPYRRK